MNKGIVEEIIGRVVNVKFPAREAPAIYNALCSHRSTQEENGAPLVLRSTESPGRRSGEMYRHSRYRRATAGVEVYDTGEPIKVPVGKETLGRMFNVLGEAIDGKALLYALPY